MVAGCGNAPMAAWETQCTAMLDDTPLRGAAGAGDDKAQGKRKLRAHQRAMLELTEKLAEKAAQMEIAEQEKKRLERRLKVLETVIPVRDQQIAYMQQQQEAAAHMRRQVSAPVLHPPTCVINRLPSTASGASGSSESNPPSASTPGGGMATDSDDLSPTAGALVLHNPHGRYQERVAAAQSTLTALYQRGLYQDFGEQPLAPPGELLPGGRGVGVTALGTPEAVLREFRESWCAWVQLSSLQLHAHDARPEDVQPQLRIEQAYDRLLSGYRLVRLAHPNVITDVLAMDMETGAKLAAPPSERFWASVARSLKASPEQVADCRAALTLYHERLDTAMAERKVLLQQLQPALAQVSVTDGSVTQLQSVVQVEELVERLKKNVARQQDAGDLVKDFLGSGIFNRIQAARAAVLAYPHFPDAIALLNAIVALQ